MAEILRRVSLSSPDAETVVETVLANPKKYGFLSVQLDATKIVVC